MNAELLTEPKSHTNLAVIQFVLWSFAPIQYFFTKSFIKSYKLFQGSGYQRKKLKNKVFSTKQFWGVIIK